MRSLKTPLMLGSLLLFGAGPAMAGPVVLVNVPFPFTVHGQSMPAGQIERVEVITNPEWDMPGVGRFARIHDPEGNPIELWQPDAPAES